MARSFNGTSQYLNGSPPVSSIVEGISFAVWFYPTASANSALVAMRKSSAGNSWVYCLTRTTGVLEVSIRNDTNTQTETATTSTTYALNQWQQAGGFISLSKRTVFVNGAGKATNSVAITPFDALSIMEVARHPTFSQLFAGRIAHLAFWYGELDDSDFADLAAGAHPLAVRPELLANYFPIAGSASPEPDLLRPQFTLTLNGSPTQVADPSINASPAPPPGWSTPTALFSMFASLASAGLSGRLHAIGDDGVGLRVRHRYSDDQGATWSSATTVSTADRLPLYEPMAAAGDRVYVVARDTTFNQLKVRASADGGGTWGSPVTLTGYSADDSDRVHVVAEDDSVHIFCGRAGATPDSSFKVYYWRSTDGGATYDNSAAATILDASTSEPPSPGGIAVHEGVVHVGYSAFEAIGTLGERARYLRSTDNGATWPGSPTAIDGAGTVPQIRTRPVAANGRVLVGWEHAIDFNQGAAYPNATEAEIAFARSMDGGDTWEAPAFATNRPQDYCNHPVLAIGPGPLVHMIYRMSLNQATLSNSDNMGYRLSTNYGTTWQFHEIAMVLGSASPHPVTLVVTQGYVHASAESGYYVRRQIVEPVITGSKAFVASQAVATAAYW